MSQRGPYFPDDLPEPKPAANVERQYLQCGCIVNESAQDNNLYSNYGDPVSYIPATSPMRRMGSGSSFGSPLRAASPPVSEPGEEEVVRVIDSGYCERTSCQKSSIFNKEWLRIWEANNTQMRKALDEDYCTNGKAFKEFKARIRREAQLATEARLRSQQ